MHTISIFCGLQKLNTLNLRHSHPPLNPRNHFSTVLIKTNWYTISCKYSNCSGLKELTLSNRLKSIEDSAFYGCTGLAKITSLAEIPPVFDRCMFVGEEFGEVNKANCELIVPEESITAYKQAKGWNEFSNIRGFVGEKK